MVVFRPHAPPIAFGDLCVRHLSVPVRQQTMRPGRGQRQPWSQWPEVTYREIVVNRATGNGYVHRSENLEIHTPSRMAAGAAEAFRS
ncbi:MAG: hypothetical protein ACYCS1_10460 [Gammaproteobacteria bacterium]